MSYLNVESSPLHTFYHKTIIYISYHILHNIYSVNDQMLTSVAPTHAEMAAHVTTCSTSSHVHVRVDTQGPRVNKVGKYHF